MPYPERRTPGFQAGFNRTFMELKWYIGFFNDSAELSFNRTFMELKSAGNIYKDVRIDSFNRTFMELKLFLRLTVMRLGLF